LKCLRKKFGPIFKELLKKNPKTQKIFNMLSNIWVWDPGSGIRKKPIPDPGSRGQKGTGSRIRIRNTGFNEVSGSGSRRAKMTNNNRKNLEISCFEVLEILF
jgi:hypothetical protein